MEHNSRTYTFQGKNGEFDSQAVRFMLQEQYNISLTAVVESWVNLINCYKCFYKCSVF